MDKVEVLWVDSSHGFGWFDKECPHDIEGVSSCGYLLEDKPGYITLTISQGEQGHAQTVTIPRPCIVGNIKKLREE